MERIIYDISLVTAGIPLCMGLIMLGIGIRRTKSQTELTFGLLGILLGLFILTPPIGFVTSPVTRYSDLLLFKRIFIFSYYVIFPWFLYYYSGRPGRKAPFAISLFVFLSYFGLFVNMDRLPSPLWTYFAVVIFAINLIYGVA